MPWGRAQRVRRWLAAAVVVAACARSVAGAQCVGDCNDDGRVLISELITGVNIALGTVAVSRCRSFDANGDGQVAVNELITGVGNGLGMCTLPQRPFPELVSVTMAGSAGEADSSDPAVSADGRFVAFVSAATGLTLNGSGTHAEVYVRDTCLGAPTGTCTPSTTLASVQNGTDVEGDADAGVGPAISADGRFVAFASRATNLVEGATAGKSQIYLRDTCLGEPNVPSDCAAGTSIVSVDTNGQPGSTDSFRPSISDDGRRVAFESFAALEPADQNGTEDIYLYDTATRAIAVASVFDAAAGTVSSQDASLSGDGRFVAFVTTSGETLESVTYLRDTCGPPSAPVAACVPATTLVSADADGNAVTGLKPSVNGDGRFVAFHSDAPSLNPTGPSTHPNNVYVRDTCNGAPVGCRASTTFVSLDRNGGRRANGDSDRASISADARFVAFASTADNLTDDSNGATEDVFLGDTCLGPRAPGGCAASTLLLSTDRNGVQGAQASTRPALSGNGAVVAFESDVENLAATPNQMHTQVYIVRNGIAAAAP
jgi:hypothetical protein